MRCSNRNILLPLMILLVCVAVAPCVVAQTQQWTDVGGRTPTAEELQALDISIGPEGKELPPGSGTAKEGAPIFASKCAYCHGPTASEAKFLFGRLAGGQGTLTTFLPVKTTGSFWPYATTIWDFIRRAMPEYPVTPVPEGGFYYTEYPIKPIGSAAIRGGTFGMQTNSNGTSLLSVDQIYAVTAFLLFKNGIIKEDDVMNRETLPKVQMPNRNGFLPAGPPFPVWKSRGEMRVEPYVSPNSKPLPPNSKPVNAVP